MTNSLKFKRFIAYFIDLFIISILTVLLSRVNILNPMQSKYNKVYKEYISYSQELRESLENGTVVDTNDIITEEYIKYTYDLDRYGVSYLIIEFVVCVCYFTILPFFNDGQTFGKEFLKITIVNSDDSRVSFWKLLLKAFILPIFSNLLLYTCLLNGITSGLVFVLKPHYYFYTKFALSFVFCIYCYTDIIFLLANKKGISLHDFLLRTKVIEYARTK